jgi:hypothetical protein
MQEILRACLRVEGILYEGLGRSVRLGIVRVARVRVPSGAVGLRRRPCLGESARLLRGLASACGSPSKFTAGDAWPAGDGGKANALRLEKLPAK